MMLKGIDFRVSHFYEYEPRFGFATTVNAPSWCLVW
jgi:hypothetical protein